MPNWFSEEYRNKVSDNAHKSIIKGRFGVNYEELMKLHNGVCAICSGINKTRTKRGFKRLAVDHNHTTGKVRGLLCQNCNWALGCLEDNLERVEKLVLYLKKYM
jgi:hypothetical protein